MLLAPQKNKTPPFELLLLLLLLLGKVLITVEAVGWLATESRLAGRLADGRTDERTAGLAKVSPQRATT